MKRVLLLAVLGTGLGNTSALSARRVPDDFATIQAAIDASGSGDTVLVAPGLYGEHVTITRSVTVRAEGAPASVVLDAANAGPAVSVSGGATLARLEGLRLTNGSGQDLGGATLGGVLAAVGGRVDATDCAFDQGQATYGGLTGASGATMNFERCAWQNGDGGYGGAHFQAGGKLMLDGGTIAGTSASAAGGGLYLTGGTSGSVLATTITGTMAAGDGGGMRLDDCVLALSNLRIDGATAGGRGGGLAVAAGGQVIATALVLVDCGSSLGGGLFHLSCAPALAAGFGATTTAECASLTMSHCDLLLGRGAAPAAGAVTDAAAFRMESSLAAGSTSGFACLDPRATLEITCSDLYRNGSADITGSCAFATSGNLAADPHLCDLAQRDVGLCANSPLLAPGCGSAPWGAGVLTCADCGPTPARPATWGMVKARYR